MWEEQDEEGRILEVLLVGPCMDEWIALIFVIVVSLVMDAVSGASAQTHASVHVYLSMKDDCTKAVVHVQPHAWKNENKHAGKHTRSNFSTSVAESKLHPPTKQITCHMTNF